jgi:small redox-active disulfide protein 2
MDIKVLGPGCANCKRLYEETARAVLQLGVPATISKVEKHEEIAAFGVFMTPALVINEQVKSAGRIPNAAEITSWLATAAMAEQPEGRRG